jgi:hypothetical protein
MNRFGGRFVSSMKQELAVGDSPARFGSDGGRFTTLALISVSLSRSLSLPLTLTLARLQSPSHSFSLAHSQSPSHTHRQFGSRSSVIRWRYRRFRATPHPRAFPVGFAHLRGSATNFVQGWCRTPKLDQREI